ncbi:MAG: hypothetical protein J6A89_01470 [Clostridia bacterium]|nr:hypothetical protein [Clostridia bacterium]
MNDEGVEEIFIDVIHIQNQVWQLNYYEAENGKRDKSCKMSIIADFTAIPTECILAYVEKDSLGNIGECNEYMLKIVQFMTAVRAYMIMSHLTDGPMPESATDTSWRKATIEPVSINLFGKMVMI